MLSRRALVLLGVVTGIALELGVQALGGRREAWDSPAYWTIGLPIVVLASVAFGFLSRERDWIGAVVIVPSQLLTMMARNGEVGGLWPLTIALSSILSTPFIVAAFIGSRFRRKSSRRQNP
jgi:predicted permease